MKCSAVEREPDGYVLLFYMVKKRRKRRSMVDFIVWVVLATATIDSPLSAVGHR